MDKFKEYQELLNEAKTFCSRVEKGEIKSKKTYLAFKTIIEKIEHD